MLSGAGVGPSPGIAEGNGDGRGAIGLVAGNEAGASEPAPRERGGVALLAARGLAGALASSRLLASFLFEVRPSDPGTLLAVAFVLALVAVLASIVPAMRATRIDPAIALRSE